MAVSVPAEAVAMTASAQAAHRARAQAARACMLNPETKRPLPPVCTVTCLALLAAAHAGYGVVLRTRARWSEHRWPGQLARPQ